MKDSAKTTLILSCLFMLLAIIIGAFGAHALQPHMTEKGLATFKTGSLYHLIHALGLLGLGLFQLNSRGPSEFNSVRWTMLLGIIFFSFNCYLYAITHERIFAMIVPIGGTLFLISWSLFLYKIIGLSENKA